jgi:hypothetical protein
MTWYHWVVTWLPWLDTAFLVTLIAALGWLAYLARVFDGE